MVVAKEGVLGLMGRGLKTKLIANGLQGVMFSVFWRLGQVSDSLAVTYSDCFCLLALDCVY